jgi:hypothetical protein
MDPQAWPDVPDPGSVEEIRVAFGRRCGMRFAQCGSAWAVVQRVTVGAAKRLRPARSGLRMCGRSQCPASTRARVGKGRKPVAFHVGAVRVVLRTVALVDPRLGDDLPWVMGLGSVAGHTSGLSASGGFCESGTPNRSSLVDASAHAVRGENDRSTESREMP